MNRAEFRRLSTAKLADARALLRARRYDAAYYMAGYVVECGLKACIARQFRAGHIPDRGSVDKVYTHQLRVLLGLAGLSAAQATEALADPLFETNWQTVQGWSESSRYELGRPALVAQNMVDSVADPQHGVHQWLKRHW